MRDLFRRIIRAWTSDYQPVLRRPPLFWWLTEKIKTYRASCRVKRLLGDRSKADVLKKVPYRYGYWQGDNGFRIYDPRHKDPATSYLHFVSGIEVAELWILERYLREINGLPLIHRGFYEKTTEP